MASKIVRGPINDLVRPFCWLLGKWRSTGAEVSYPTMEKSVCYEEELVFDQLGQPMVNYSSTTWNPQTKAVMHMERGFLGMVGDCAMLLTVQNFGVITREEGVMKDNTLILSTNCVVHSHWAKKPVKGIYRCFRLGEDGNLEMCTLLETPTVPPTLHLHATYEKETQC